MSAPAPPPIEKRRQKQFESELIERARAWIPQWVLAEDEPDFGGALLKIAARFSSEVAERLDRGGEKMQRGFLDWLAVRGAAARAARMPVVLKLADSALDPVLAIAPVRLQADTEGAPVFFETVSDVFLLPGQRQAVVACDGTSDAFYLPPPGLNDLKPLEPLPTQWRLKSFAAAEATKIQLDPDTGLVQDMIVEAAGKQYRITAAEKDIVSIEPPLGEGLNEGQVVNKVTTFAPFDGAAHNWQEHALYLGDADLLNIEAEAKIEIVGAKGIGDDVAWQYWAGDEKGWQPLKLGETQTSGGIVLEKPKGAIETSKVKDISSRWIRAYKATASGDPFRTDRELGLRINSTDCGKRLIDLRCKDTEKAPSPAAQAMANTTPLVLDQTFYPLGKEPKQFDAFYLGSQEAFSKKKAEVQLCFEMADLSFAALSTVTVDQPQPATSILAGVGQDGFLHLLQFDPTTRSLTKFRNRVPLQPPLPGLDGVTPPTPNPVALDRRPPWRLPMWKEGSDILVGTTAGNEVWVWHEKDADQTKSGWVSLGQLPPAAAIGSPPAVDGLVYLDAAVPKIVALDDGKLYVRDWLPGAQWQQVDTLDSGPGNNPVTLKSIVPVLVDNLGQLATSASAGMMGVSDVNDLYSVDIAGTCVFLTNHFSIEFRPAAVEDSGGNTTVVGVDSRDPLNSSLIASPPATAGAGVIPSGANVAGAIDVLLNGSDLHFLISAKGTASSYLVDWTPFVTTPSPPPIESEIPPEVGQVGGAPSALPHDVIVPGASADLLVAAFDPSQQKVDSAQIKAGVVVPDSNPVDINDVIVLDVAGNPEPHFVSGPRLTKSGEVFYPLVPLFSPTGTGTVLAYRQASALSGTVDPSDNSLFTLNSSDSEGTTGEWLLIGSDFYQVVNIDANNPRKLTISPATGSPMPPVGNYVRPMATGGRVAPFMELDPGTNGDWDADLLQRIKLSFPGKQPTTQRAKAFNIDPENHPLLVVLGQAFQAPFSSPATFIVNAVAGTWTRLLGDTSANPELSWEYWNGKGWWKLPIQLDGTSNLKSSGALEFQIPDDIAATDWSGKTDFWIRARLVGGDYGREKVTVITTPLPNGNSQQTVERSSEGIRPPQVLKLHIFYRICEPSTPTYLLAQDSGSIRDQSDANRTGGAIVEAFVPLGVMLARLSRPTAQSKTREQCPPECQCRSEAPAGSAAPAAATAIDDGTIAPETGRSLFIGFDKPLSQQPVNVLLVVEKERGHEKFAPMKVEALTGDRFVPIVANDTTRALGESGLLSMSFSVGPTSRELFNQTLYWLRLTPAGTDSSDWKPTLRGAYLNAVWASATETMTRELVGSSEGAPNLTLRLARPPLLDHTLELRVKEPLGEEARTALLKMDKNSVLSSVEGLPGDWVLWKQVTDPGDEAPDARVYALDESNGEIRFGDGRHGAIPPIGTDSIVAFTYKRTEPGAPGTTDVPANSITARAQLGLVSPVPTVEAAFAADQAAGGAPPEPVERVVRFGSARLRHRERAVTARDLEDLALQSSPKIAQARCIVRPSYVKLVVVMRGDSPGPNAAEVRELRRLLLPAAPPALGANQFLRIQGPDLRLLRAELNLAIADLDYSGEVARDAKQAIKNLFDVTTGGIAKNGWQLGESPRESDIAYVLSNVPRLEAIKKLRFTEITDDLNERTWPTSLKPTELAVLSKDPVGIEFTVAEVLA
jgi:hypothetical protein